jgi:hypothetical protein
MADKSPLSWLKKSALKIYLNSPRRVQIGLAKFGIKKVVQKKTNNLKKSVKALA